MRTYDLPSVHQHGGGGGSGVLLVCYPLPHVCNEIGYLIVHLYWRRPPFSACNFKNIVCADVSHSLCRMQGDAHCDVGSSFVGTVHIATLSLLKIVWRRMVDALLLVWSAVLDNR
jgi:hypothetical protein